jgi:hypothetical protein
MAERDYRWDRDESRWREENRERDEGRFDRGERYGYGRREAGEYGRPLSGGFEGYGFERYRQGQGQQGQQGQDEDRWRRESEPGRYGRDFRPYEQRYERPSYQSYQPYQPRETQGRAGQWRYGSEPYSETARQPRMGRPPRNYTRTDDRIREDLCEAIIRAQDIDASEMEVLVQGFEVTLVGVVDDRDDKRRIEDIAQETPGVTEVHNQLRTKQGSGLRDALSRTGEAIKQFVTGEPARDPNNPTNDRSRPATSPNTANPPTR